jgi:hypothetical protein
MACSRIACRLRKLIWSQALKRPSFSVQDLEKIPESRIDTVQDDAHVIVRSAHEDVGNYFDHAGTLVLTCVYSFFI